MRVLVTGGRDFADEKAIDRALSALRPEPTLIIQGGAKGADTLAAQWAGQHLCLCITEKAQWSVYGFKAGVLRNRDMLVKHKPDVVLAFPGGTGTAHMKRIAREAGVKVVEVGEDGKELP